MSKKFKTGLKKLAIIALALSLCACGAKKTEESSSTGSTSSAAGSSSTKTTPGGPPASIYEFNILREEGNGHVVLNYSIDEFNGLGFCYGDSLDVEFTNGYKLTDIPYYDGFYAKKGNPLVCPSLDGESPMICFARGDSLWDVSGVTEEDEVKISINKAGRYRNVELAMSLTYATDRVMYVTDEEFANFRALKGGNLKDKLIYRSASMCCGFFNRAKYVDALAKAKGIAWGIDLADTTEDLELYYADEYFQSYYFKELIDSGNIEILGLDNDYASDVFAKKVADSLMKICDKGGPVLIFGIEGIERTGYVCQLLMALGGCTEEEITNDYMMSYKNYLDINEVETKEFYDAILATVASNFTEYIRELSDDGTLYGGARKYLAKGGLSEEDIDRLIAAICK